VSPRSTLLAAALCIACNAGAASSTAPAAGIVPSYLAIATALAADELGPVAEQAAELERLAGTMSNKPGMDKVTSAAKRLSGSDIAATRAAFKTVSDGVLDYMRATPTTQAGNVVVFCPMAFEDMGALWVQAEGKIANPYFGASMLRCGNKLAWDATLPATAAL
jgi:Protein of unknown function (DUF3347)